jgi:hypothetical protein
MSAKWIHMIQDISVTWGGGGQGGANVPQYFFILRIVYLVTELNNGKYKIERKKKTKNVRFMGPIFPSFKFDSIVK